MTLINFSFFSQHEGLAKSTGIYSYNYAHSPPLVTSSRTVDDSSADGFCHTYLVQKVAADRVFLETKWGP